MQFSNVVFTLQQEEGANGEAWAVLPAGLVYLVWQQEKGGEGNNVHLQGYLELATRRSLSWLKDNFSATAHYEKRRGSQVQAIDYCKKADTRMDGPWELGERKKQGQRQDIINFRNAVKEGKRKRELVEDMPLMLCKFPKYYNLLQGIYRPKRPDDFEKVNIMLLYGATGTGKTRAVYSRWKDSEEFWRMPINNGTPWFDDYDMHKKVLMDDFAGRSSKMSLVMLLQLLDRYPVRVPVKGAHTWWMPTKIVITSNIHPRDWYNWEKREEQYRALKRRITQTIEFFEQDPDLSPSSNAQPRIVEDEFWWRHLMVECAQTDWD